MSMFSTRAFELAGLPRAVILAISAVAATALVPATSFGQALPVAEASDIPNRPEELSFGALDFEVPPGDKFRYPLDAGAIAYIAEDHTFPLVSIRVTLKQGSFLDPEGKIGLSSLTGSMMRRGGTARLSAADFDERVEFLAASISSGAGENQASAGVSCITPVLEESLDLFFEMLREPAFDEERLKIEKSNILEAMKQRNDDADDILDREWDWLLYGEDFHGSRRITQAHLDGIGPTDLASFHEKYWRPERMIFSISGDVDVEEIIAEINQRLADWPGEGAPLTWPPPQPGPAPKPGLYHVEKDIPQGKVRIGHRTPQWTDWTNPDRAAIQVMDHILGASGFTSRIMQRVRSDEGLAYSARASFGFDPWAPGSYEVNFQSKSSTVALAAQISLGELRRMQEELVTNEELNIAKNSLKDSFPRRFESARQRVSIFASDEMLERSHDYWVRWREQIEAVSAEDVRRVAEKYLAPDEIVFLVVGKWEDIEPGDADDRANMKEFFGGEVEHLSLRDPLSLKPLEPQ